MTFDPMRMRLTFTALAALCLLGACGKKAEKVVVPPDAGGAQITTSIDDSDLPSDRSARITSIDAATGDASGMPKDGGKAIEVARPEPKKAAPVATPAQPAEPAPPLIAPPPPVPAAATPAAPTPPAG
jgi:hypothetical protein